MKRVATSFFLSASVPAAVFFVLTASPARLYAEAAAAPPACNAPEVTACDGKDGGAACSIADGGAGVCESRLCANADSGTNINAFVCVPPAPCASQQQIDDCAGKNVGQSCGNGGTCGLLNCLPAVDGGDGGSTPVCLYTGANIDASADAAPDARSDGSANPDGAASPDGSDASTKPGSVPPASDDEGCSCRAAGAPASPWSMAGGLALSVLALFALRRRAR